MALVVFPQDQVVRLESGETLTITRGTPTKLSVSKMCTPKKSSREEEDEQAAGLMGRTEGGHSWTGDAGDAWEDDGEDNIYNDDENEEEEVQQEKMWKKGDFCGLGTGDDVLFLGPKQEEPYHWDMKMRDYFVKNPADGSKMVLARTSVNIMVGILGKLVGHHIQLHQGFAGFGQAENLKVTYQGEECSQKKLWDFPEGAVFLLTIGALPGHLSGHKGYLFQCLGCDRAGTRKQQIARAKVKCKHNYLFGEDLRTMPDQARSRDRRPQHCPRGHYGPRHLDPVPEELALAAAAPAPARAAAPAPQAAPAGVDTDTWNAFLAFQAAQAEGQVGDSQDLEQAAPAQAKPADVDRATWNATLAFQLAEAEGQVGDSQDLEQEWVSNEEIGNLIDNTASPSHQVRFVHFGPFRHSNYQKNF